MEIRYQYDESLDFCCRYDTDCQNDRLYTYITAYLTGDDADDFYPLRIKDKGALINLPHRGCHYPEKDFFDKGHYMMCYL